MLQAAAMQRREEEKKITSTKERLARSKESKQAEAEDREISKPLETAFVVMEGVVPRKEETETDGELQRRSDGNHSS